MILIRSFESLVLELWFFLVKEQNLAGTVDFLFPSWISRTGAEFEHFSDIFRHQVPQKIGFFQRKGRKRTKEWREVTFMSTMATSRRWTYPNTFFRFQKRAILKFPVVQLNFYLVNFMVC